jgi:SAM-dependent methyltransferase
MFNEEYANRYKDSFSRFDLIFQSINQNFENITILDFGSGTGQVIDYLNISPLNYLGFDVSEAMLEKSRKSYQDYKFINDLTDATDNYFKVIFMFDCLNFMEQKEIIDNLKILREKISDEGRLYIHMPRKNSIFALLWKMRFHNFPAKLHSDSEIIFLFQKCGFNLLDKKILGHYQWPLNLFNLHKFPSNLGKLLSPRTVMIFSIK